MIQPELANAPYDDPLEQVNWEEVTLGALASQLSGLGRDCQSRSMPLFCQCFTNNIPVRLGDYAVGGIDQFGSTQESTAFAIANGFPPPLYDIPPDCAYYSNDLPTCNRASKCASLPILDTRKGYSS